MNDELEQELFEAHPEIFEYARADPEEFHEDDQYPPMICVSGLSIGDGWYDMVDALCTRLESYDVECRAVQVKEKFGGLRFYTDGIRGDERRVQQASGAIHFAQEMSYHICEECGNSGDLRTSGWYRTLCDECWSEEKQRRRELSPRFEE